MTDAFDFIFHFFIFLRNSKYIFTWFYFFICTFMCIFTLHNTRYIKGWKLVSGIYLYIYRLKVCLVVKRKRIAVRNLSANNLTENSRRRESNPWRLSTIKIGQSWYAWQREEHKSFLFNVKDIRDGVYEYRGHYYRTKASNFKLTL